MRSYARGGARVLKVLVPAVILAPAIIAWSAARHELAVQPQSRLWVEGTSTVRGFECKATSFQAHVEAAGPTAVSAVLAGERGVSGVELTVPVAQMDCGNGTMNDHMRKALKATEHPEIVFHLSSYDLAKAAEGVQATINGTLSLGGVEKPIVVNAEVKEGADGALHVEGVHEVMMKEYGLKPPSLMMGTMKVNERVKVRFDLLLK
jgi:polyisoprenoid-binding protein YceI